MSASEAVPVIYSQEKNLECRLHTCPKTLYSTFRLIFPDLASIMPSRSQLASGETSFDLNIVAVWQQTAQDMSGYSDPVQTEREEKTGTFIEWAKSVTADIKESTDCKFVDFIEPASGLPFLTARGGTIFIETDDAILNLGYQILDFGCCKAVSHPSWGAKSFLSIIMTDASSEKLAEVINKRLEIRS